MSVSAASRWAGLATTVAWVLAFPAVSHGFVTTSNGGIAGTEPTMSGRPSQTGVNSSCSAAKTFPGTASSGTPFFYDDYSLANDGPGVACVQVSLDGAGCGSGSVHPVSYQPTFDPANVSVAYLGDAGISADAAHTAAYSFLASPGTFHTIVHAVFQQCTAYALSQRVSASARTDAPTDVTMTSASLHASVNSAAESGVTYHFDYGTTAAYGSSTAPRAAGAGSSTQTVTEALGGLAPGTTAHYRVVVDYPANGGFAGGQTVGADRFFTTATATTPPLIPPPSNLPAGPDLLAPRFVAAPALSRRTFRAARRGPSALPAVGTGALLTFSLSERARVTFTVQRLVAGRRRGRTCVAHRRIGRRCLVVRRLQGSFAVSGAAGRNRLRFRGRLRGRALPPGNYRLTAFARDAAGNSSRQKYVAFRIVS
jgi:hypothetical protein